MRRRGSAGRFLIGIEVALAGPSSRGGWAGVRAGAVASVRLLSGLSISGILARKVRRDRPFVGTPASLVLLWRVEYCRAVSAWCAGLDDTPLMSGMAWA